MSLWPITLLATLSGLLIAGLFACEDAPITQTMRRVEDPWAVAHGAGVLPLIVRGRPGFATETAVEDAVLRAVTGAMTWTAAPPVALASASSAGERIHLVYAFNAAGGDPCGADQASSPAGGEPRPDGRVELTAVLCEDGEWLARVDGRLRRSDGIEDRRFGRLVGQATRDLLAPPPAPRP